MLYLPVRTSVFSHVTDISQRIYVEPLLTHYHVMSCHCEPCFSYSFSNTFYMLGSTGNLHERSSHFNLYDCVIMCGVLEGIADEQAWPVSWYYSSILQE
jgi:hypothetical protein